MSDQGRGLGVSLTLIPRAVNQQADYFARVPRILPFNTSPFAYFASNVPVIVLPL